MHETYGRSAHTVGESQWTHSSAAADRSAGPDQLPVELTAAVVALLGEEPAVLIRRGNAAAGQESVASLPSEHYRPRLHVELDDAIRARVVTQTGIELGHIEQLATECRANGESGARGGQPRLSVGYLALIRIDAAQANSGDWVSCYDFMPWEDWRRGRPAILTDLLLPGLDAWARSDPDETPGPSGLTRRDQLQVAFAANGGKWDDERVVERLELLDAAGLTDQAAAPLRADHRRILATALGRLRARIRNRPLVFELLQPEFTLFELQKTVEAILGPHLHKQNFRRLVEGAGLVEPTGEVRNHTGGRPAKLFRFRREVVLERPAPGVRIRAGRAA